MQGIIKNPHANFGVSSFSNTRDLCVQTNKYTEKGLTMKVPYKRICIWGNIKILIPFRPYTLDDGNKKTISNSRILGRYLIRILLTINRANIVFFKCFTRQAEKSRQYSWPLFQH